MINPCVKCPERDRCEGMNQPCKQGRAYEAAACFCLWFRDSNGTSWSKLLSYVLPFLSRHFGKKLYR